VTDRERRLDALREQAAAGRISAPTGGPIDGAPLPAGTTGYYGRPLLKPPVWTWEIPVYLFVGGIAGVSALIGAVGVIVGADPSLVRTAHIVALTGALLSPLLLISDLGRPARFLNMLRVFKVRSAMSVGAWTLVAFGGCAGAASALDTWAAAPLLLVYVVNAAAAATGVLLATYTGVLLGVTALPIWARHAAVLPVHFAASSLGAAASTLEIAGHRDAALNTIAIAAALIETAIAVLLHLRGTGATGWTIRAGEIGSGVGPLLLRTVFGAYAVARPLAASLAIAGALLTRFGWISVARRTGY
jgi:hypothetical protein